MYMYMHVQAQIHVHTHVYTMCQEEGQRWDLYRTVLHCRIYALCYVLYSRKYWWELNLVVGPQIAIAKILADLNLAVR